MSELGELTSLLWWLMLLSATAIILHDIGLAIFPKTPQQQMRAIPRKSSTGSEDELSTIVKKIRRGLQRPATFRTLQREVAQTIVQTALAVRGLPLSRLPESRPDLMNQVLRDPDLIRFVHDYATEASSAKSLITRGKMLGEFEETVRILQKAEGQLK